MSLSQYLIITVIDISITSADKTDIGISLLPNIGIGICPKNPILVGPQLVKQPKSHILTSLANQTISEETEDHYPVFYNAFAQSAQSAVTL